jgi:hypothetical protein
MDYFELYLYHCKKLQDLLEVDQIEIASSLQEDFLYEYRILLEREKEALEKLIDQAKYY